MTNARDPKHSRRPADLGPESEFGRLVGALCDGTLTRPGGDRLEKLLADPVVRAAYREHMRLHAELVRLWHQGAGAGGKNSSGGSLGQAAAPRGVGVGRGRSGHSGSQAAAFSAIVFQWLRRLVVGLSRPVPVAMLVAGGLIAGVLGITASVKVPSSALSSGSAALVSAARITGLHETKWRSPEGSHGLADFLFAGTTLEIESGLVELRYDCGATVIVEGPAVLHVDGRSTARLDRGRLTAKLEKAGAPAAGHRAGEDLPRLFTVRTPRASVHDLGTEFGVEVREAGDADVHVFDGLVELAAADRGIATALDAVDIRLAAGDGAQIDESGRITATGGAAVKKFVRTLPKAKPGVVKPFLEQIGWNDAMAEVLYRDTFAGEGQLAGSTPASRGGVGTAGWIAQSRDWNLLDGSVRAGTAGSALVPFRPEPGWLYRLTVPFNVVAGSKGWAAIGFKEGASTSSNHGDDGIAWMLRNHPAATSHHHEVFAGRGIQGKLADWNRPVAAEIFSIVLDTSDPRWRAYFLAGNERVAMYRYSNPQTAISHAGISIYSTADVLVESFTLERVAKRPPDR